ncbi:MAG TPA: hypothetical protein VLV78_11160 [Thermoanaerobaculia bacterium]|nr:hypothetical protein [Thermoanaerobaculia bacterium]
MKRACGTWIAIYLLLAAAIGMITYRRFPLPVPAFGAAVVGGGVAWLGVAYFAGIWQKNTAARIIRRGLDGEPPRDGEKFAAIGRITPTGSPLTSPLSRSSCVAYKYEITDGDPDNTVRYYDGFALAPSVIQTGKQAVRLLAWGDLKLSWNTVPASQAKAHAEEYIGKTEIREPPILNLRQSFVDLQAIYRDDDGSVRWDQRGLRPPLDTGKPIDMSTATYREMLLRPGDPVCVIGSYSAQRGGIVPSSSPLVDPVTLEVGEPEVFTKRASVGAVGYSIGGVIFLGAVLVALVVFHALVPLEASEQMRPGMVASWPEIRLERFLDKRVRPLMREAGMLSSGEVMIQLPAGTANGRARGGGRDEVVREATAERAGGLATVTIDDRVIVLTIDANRRPIHLAILGQDVSPASADIRIDEAENDVAGRITYIPETGDGPACRVTFRTLH